MSQYHRENPDAQIVHDWLEGAKHVELPKTFEHFKYELRDEYHTFDRAQVDLGLIEKHDPTLLENWIVPASL